MAGIHVVILFMEACLTGVWWLWPWRSYRAQQARVTPNIRRLLGWRVAGLAALLLGPISPLAIWPQPLWAAGLLGLGALGAMTVVVTTLALHALKSAGKHPELSSPRHR